PSPNPVWGVPRLFSDIDLSVDDRWLYVSCWGTGELKQYDVSDPFNPRETGSGPLGGVGRRPPHPAAPPLPLAGGAAGGRPSSTPPRTAGSPRTCGSSPTGRPSAGCGCTRRGSRPGTPP